MDRGAATAASRFSVETSFVRHEPEEPQEVESSPNGRYVRYNTLLGRGACKRVYKGFDAELGMEVAWNQVELSAADPDDRNAVDARTHLFDEIRVLQKLKHKNIMSFCAWWYDDATRCINFITELFTAGTLRQYRKKAKFVTEAVVKRWAHQILEGLLYLHGHVPPIVHRDLKCDNIFINNVTGTVKIGDLGLATVQQQAMSVVGTPEFMAPEVYDETYDSAADVYSFGMCLLELATLEYPYSECHSVPQIFRKVSLGILPAGLERISSPELKDLVRRCIAHDAVQRPTARDLLKDPYFDLSRAGAGAGALSEEAMAVLPPSAAAGLSGHASGTSTPTGNHHAVGASYRDLREALYHHESNARAHKTSMSGASTDGHSSGLSRAGSFHTGSFSAASAPSLATGLGGSLSALPLSGGGGEPGSGGSSFSMRASPLAGSAPAPAFVVGSPLSRVVTAQLVTPQCSSPSNGVAAAAAAVVRAGPNAHAPLPGAALSPLNDHGDAVDYSGLPATLMGPQATLAVRVQQRPREPSFAFTTAANAEGAVCTSPQLGLAPGPWQDDAHACSGAAAYAAAAAAAPGSERDERSTNWDDDDDEVFVPIGLLLAGLKEEGFVSDDEAEAVDNASRDGSQLGLSGTPSFQLWPGAAAAWSGSVIPLDGGMDDGHDGEAGPHADRLRLGGLGLGLGEPRGGASVAEAPSACSSLLDMSANLSGAFAQDGGAPVAASPTEEVVGGAPAPLVRSASCQEWSQPVAGTSGGHSLSCGSAGLQMLGYASCGQLSSVPSLQVAAPKSRIPSFKNRVLVVTPASPPPGASPEQHGGRGPAAAPAPASGPTQSGSAAAPRAPTRPSTAPLGGSRHVRSTCSTTRISLTGGGCRASPAATAVPVAAVTSPRSPRVPLSPKETAGGPLVPPAANSRRPPLPPAHRRNMSWGAAGGAAAAAVDAACWQADPPAGGQAPLAVPGDACCLLDVAQNAAAGSSEPPGPGSSTPRLPEEEQLWRQEQQQGATALRPPSAPAEAAQASAACTAAGCIELDEQVVLQHYVRPLQGIIVRRKLLTDPRSRHHRGSSM